MISKRVAIVHDALCVAGGAERVALWMLEAFPEAKFFTSVYLPNNTFAGFMTKSINALPNSGFVKSEKQFKLSYLYWLSQIQKIDFSNFDLVLSSSTYLAKYIKVPKGVKHISYLHAPFRLLWKPNSYYSSSLPIPIFLMPLIKLLLPRLRSWDKQKTGLLQTIVTNSQNMQREISNVYDRDSSIIYPPVDIDAYPVQEKIDDYYIIVGRQISHKKFDIVIEACNRLNKHLVVVGDGPERISLQKIAGPTISFLGRLSDTELKEVLSKSRALIFPSHEDFGIVPVEAQACGVPVIAYGEGGALETVNEYVSGVFFKEQTAHSLMEKIVEFEKLQFSSHKIRSGVEKFDITHFISALQNLANLN